MTHVRRQQFRVFITLVKMVRAFEAGDRDQGARYSVPSSFFVALAQFLLNLASPNHDMNQT